MTDIRAAIEMANAMNMPLATSDTEKIVQGIQRAWRTGARDGSKLALEMAAQVCQNWIDDHSKADNCTYNDCDMVAAVTDVRDAILQLQNPTKGPT